MTSGNSSDDLKAWLKGLWKDYGYQIERSSEWSDIEYDHPEIKRAVYEMMGWWSTPDDKFKRV